jgi:hypothetical protein
MSLNPYISNPTTSGKLPVTNSVGGNSYYSIQPDARVYGDRWVASGAIPRSFSAGGWTSGNQGYVQQTFLGASIIDFSMNGGFGDTSSTLSVNLINDEYNISDGTVAGYGDDVYHSGFHDRFAPPMVGSPVFFKFGKTLATVQQAYTKTFDDLYDYSVMSSATPTFLETSSLFNMAGVDKLESYNFVDVETQKILTDIDKYNQFMGLPPSSTRGKNHLVFGGILQTYTQNRGMGGNPQYSVQVIDPREILSNVVLILNNYAGTVNNNKNIINIYGFLEHNLSTSAIDTNFPVRTHTKSVLTKNVLADSGIITYSGNDTYYANPTFLAMPVTFNSVPPIFPITGTGFSRRGDQGIPYYRIKDAINALMQKNGVLPDEYKEAGFGGTINFRGFNYIVDFGGLPSLPDLYYLDFDQINLLDLCMEICDITSHDMFVSLLPIINHPACDFLFKYNTDIKEKASAETDADKKKAIGSRLIAGIIRIDTVNKSIQPQYGAIKSYIDNLASQGIYVENQDVGYELSNVTTDKFIVGAQEVDMYYFSSNADRDFIELRKAQNGVSTNRLKTLLGDQWKLQTSLNQQILPYYGTLGSKNAISIPKGFGAYQQILLDTATVNSNGLGAYYVATEMELRCALISFERWKNFLLSYNDLYMESVEINDAAEMAALQATPATAFGGANIPHANGINVSNNYVVSVPRSVFPSYSYGDQTPNYNALEQYGPDGLPRSPCNPPYGYPLYFKRATKIGIPEAGLTEISSRLTSLITGLAKIKSSDKENYKVLLNSEWSRLQDLANSPTGLSQAEKTYYDYIKAQLANDDGNVANGIGLVEDSINSMGKSFQILPKLAKQGTENAMRIYNFIKGVAEECLGKKFLVKIPKEVNVFYNSGLALKNYGSEQKSLKINEFASGMFAFRPRPVNSGVGYQFSQLFKTSLDINRNLFLSSSYKDSNHAFDTFLSSSVPPNPTQYAGALSVNYNPIADIHEFNYTPNKDGGYFDFDLYDNTMTFNQVSGIVSYSNKPIGVQNLFIPQDLTNFINDRNRVSAYVRFDHSQHLAFDGLNSDSYSQQAIVAGAMIPDLGESLHNTKETTFNSFPSPYTQSNPEQTLTESVAFVRCDIDDKFYMPPKMALRKTHVHGVIAKDIGRLSRPAKIYRPPPLDDYVDSVPFYVAHYIPTSGVLGEEDYFHEIVDFKHRFEPIMGSNIINTDIEDLDTNHVYALITLPGRIIPTKDARFRDGLMQVDSAEKFKHFLTMDTVKELRGFDKPSKSKNTPTRILDEFKGTIPTSGADQALLAAKAALSNLSFAQPYQINATMPSPVYPDLVALPLMSRERCYGPWISSQLDGQAIIYESIGGRVEFIKDENLAPWNFNGYQLLNYAGATQAEFSNSLLLFSERGGFVVPDAPQGVSLCKELSDRGPLVTNITVDIGSNGIKTTYKLDLYTSSFGKMQKQKQDAISKLSRERQKLKDEKNSLIRRGLGKTQKSQNYKTMQESIFNSMGSSSNSGPLSTSRLASPNLIVTSNRQNTQNNYSPNQPNTPVSRTTNRTSTSMQNTDTLSQTAESFPDQLALSRDYYNTAAQSLDEQHVPASYDPYHPNMAFRPDPMEKAKNNLYYTDGATIPKTTTYEV